jgi:hypothetical protein
MDISEKREDPPEGGKILEGGRDIPLARASRFKTTQLVFSKNLGHIRVQNNPTNF